MFLSSESERTDKAHKYLMIGGDAASLVDIIATMLFMGEIVKTCQKDCHKRIPIQYHHLFSEHIEKKITALAKQGANTSPDNDVNAELAKRSGKLSKQVKSFKRTLQGVNSAMSLASLGVCAFEIRRTRKSITVQQQQKQ